MRKRTMDRRRKERREDRKEGKKRKERKGEGKEVNGWKGNKKHVCASLPRPQTLFEDLLI